MSRREELVRRWFDMWLAKEDRGILELFAPDAVYIESWGPIYTGNRQIRHWFDEWNRRGTVVQWDIRQFFHREDQTVAEWLFRNRMADGTREEFEGMTLVRWTPEDRIIFLQEFGCNLHRYDPYREGAVPRFQEGEIRWF